MLCCVGLFIGVIAGAYFGVPWAPYLTIPLGAAGGLLADITIFRTIDKKNKRGSEEEEQKETSRNQMCCASIFNLKKKKRRKTESAVASEN